MIRPALYNITAYQGATYDEGFIATIDGQPVSWNGYTGRMQIREFQNKNSNLIWGMTNTTGLTLTAQGLVQPTITATNMASLPAGVWYYDIELIAPNGTITRFLMGKFEIKPEVSS